MEYSDYNNNGQSTSTNGCNGMLYTIQRGDTLYKLSRRYNVSLSSLMNANPNVNVYNLQVGQQICMPGGQSMNSGNMGSGNMGSGTANNNAQRPGRRPAVNNQYSGKNKNDNFTEYQCPECPTCPEQQPCPAQQPCPTCPEQRECPAQQPCPTCPPQRECPEQQPCPECPECPSCPVCETCPECEACPECPTCPPQRECPEQQPCPECEACPTCPVQEPCPTCPEQQPCPACPEQQPCPECEKCPEQKPCPACKQKNTIVYVAPAYKKEQKRECKMEKTYKYEKPCQMEKAYKYEKPCQMEKAYEYEKPCKVEKAYKYEKPCQYEKEATCEKKMPCGYKMEKKMDCGRNYDWMDGDMDSRMEKGYSCGRMYKEYPQRRMMEREESQYSCRYDFVKNSPCEEKQTKSYSDWNDCCKYGVISEDCYDRDYMDYTPKMYRGCFKKAKDCPCD